MRRNLLLLAGAIVLLLVLLEGGARILALYQPRAAQQAPIEVVPAEENNAAPAPPVYGPNEGPLDSIHAPDQWVWWKVKPGLSNYHVRILWAPGNDFHLSTNAQGFRLTGDVHSSAPRILAVGDSTAFGVGVDDDGTWPAQLESLLPHVEVVNAGVPGHSTFQALRMAEKYGMEPRPALLIICAGFNDTALTPQGERPDLERAAKNEREQARQPSEFLNLLGRAVEGAQRMAPQPERKRLTAEEYQQTLEAAQQHYASLGIPLLWVRWPTRDEVERATPTGAGYPEVLLQHCAAEGVQCIDLLPLFKAAQPSPYYDFVHATQAGNVIAAAEIAKAVKPLLKQ